MNRMESPLEQIARQSLLANAPREGDVIDENGFEQFEQAAAAAAE